MCFVIIRTVINCVRRPNRKCAGARRVEHRLYVSRLHAQRAEFHFFSVRRHAPRPSGGWSTRLASTLVSAHARKCCRLPRNSYSSNTKNRSRDFDSSSSIPFNYLPLCNREVAKYQLAHESFPNYFQPRILPRLMVFSTGCRNILVTVYDRGCFGYLISLCIINAMV